MSDTERKHVSKPGDVRRLEIFTGAGRRREWPAEVKARIVAESDAGGETVSAVARRHGLTPQQLFGWRRQARRGELAGGAAFVPVVLAKAPALNRRAAANGAGEAIVIEVAAAVIRVPPGIDAATMMAVLQAVRATA